MPFSIYKFTLQNSVSTEVSLFDSVNFQFQFLYLSQRGHSKTQSKMESQFLVYLFWLLNSFIGKVSGYHQLTQPKMRSLLNKYVFKKCIFKMLWMGRVRLHYFSRDEVKTHVDFFIFTWVFLIMEFIQYYKSYTVQV